MPPETVDGSGTVEEALRDLRSRYSWYVDDGEWAEWADLFTEDARVEYEGMPVLEGRDEILTFARETISDLYTYSMHTAQMPRLSVEEDSASGDWYLVVFYERTNGIEGWVTGTYSDEYRRVDGEWKFSYVENVIHHDSGDGSPHLK